MTALRERIAIAIGEFAWKDSFCGEHITEWDRESCRRAAGLVIQWVKEQGYVKLDEDQSLPYNFYSRKGWIEEVQNYAYSRSQQDMLAANFRRDKPC